MTIEQALKTRNYIIAKEGTGIFIGNSRLKFCLWCNSPYLVSMKKTIGKSQYCSHCCQLKAVGFQKNHTINNGKKLSEAHKKLLSELMAGSKSHLWKGGITEKNALIRASYEYKYWRRQVFERDGWRCVQCGKGGYLYADHIMPFAYFPKLRFEVNNGRTLCRECHKKTDTFAQKARNKYEN